MYAASQYHLPDFGIVNVAPCSDGFKFALVLDFRLPSLKVIVPDPFDKGVRVAKLFVGLSDTTSDATKSVTVKSFVFALSSSPIALESSNGR